MISHASAGINHLHINMIHKILTEMGDIYMYMYIYKKNWHMKNKNLFEKIKVRDGSQPLPPPRFMILRYVNFLTCL